MVQVDAAVAQIRDIIQKEEAAAAAKRAPPPRMYSYRIIVGIDPFNAPPHFNTVLKICGPDVRQDATRGFTHHAHERGRGGGDCRATVARMGLVCA